MSGAAPELLLSALVAAPVLACTAYLFVLSIFARPAPPLEHARAPELRFDVLVPAHDEEAGIGATIASLRALDYPEDLYRVIVIADNCADGTACVARDAGAIVLERRDPARRGKGHALAYAIAAIERDAISSAVVVIDADSAASPNLLRAFALRLEAGAGAVQARYGVRNPDASWRTRLMVVALALFNDLRSLGRERLGLSTGLRGNGMAFTREVLRRVPPAAFSIVEDVEYGVELGEAGVRVHYVPEACVLGDMAVSGRAAESQRRRWERGRAAIAGARAPALLLRGILRRDPVLLDLALDLLVPPLGTILLAAMGGAIAAIVLRAALGGSAATLAPWLVSIGFIAVYVLRGVQISGAGLGGLRALAWAPVYIAWKLALRLRRPEQGRDEWVRTAREGERT